MRRLARIAVPLSLLAAAWAVIAFQPHHRRCLPTGSPDMAVRHPAMDCGRCHLSGSHLAQPSPFPGRMVASD
jgi:hypothetical protein